MRYPLLLGLCLLVLGGCATVPPQPEGVIMQTVSIGRDGEELRARRYMPDLKRASPNAVLVFVHGFMRSAGRHHDLAVRLARHGFVVILPELDSPLSAGALARDVHHVRTMISGDPALHVNARLYLGGFSRGSGIALAAAAQSPHPVAGLVLVDPVLSAASQRDLTMSKLPVALITAEPGACNAHGRSFTFIRSRLKPELDVTIPGATHCDPEGPSDVLCTWLCGAPDSGRKAAFEDALVNFVTAVP